MGSNRAGDSGMKFKVYESATTVCVYEIEAETEDDAYDIVDEGYAEPVRTEYIEREIYQVSEMNSE
jgi:hypothetical protein